MHIATIVFIAWAFFVTTDRVQAANIVGYANMNIEAILQDNIVIILSPEEDIQMFGTQNSGNIETMNDTYTDKELPAT
jgi:hypothetical protein